MHTYMAIYMFGDLSSAAAGHLWYSKPHIAPDKDSPFSDKGCLPDMSGTE